VPEKFDVIVVGGGLAGLTAAYTVAQAGLKVIVIERGEQLGEKSVGGVLYRDPTEAVFPACWRDAPVERTIVAQQLWLLSPDDAAKASYHTGEPAAAFVVHGVAFLDWLGDTLIAMGGLIVSGTLVTDLLRDGRGHVLGVRTDRPDGDLLADLVLLAEGAVALLGERTGLRACGKAHQLLLSVQETLCPPGDAHARARAIEERFGLAGGDGLTITLAGALPGHACLATQRAALTFRLTLPLGDLSANKMEPYAALRTVKAHPALAPLLADCTAHAYSARLLPAAHAEQLPTLAGDGVLLVGAAGLQDDGGYRDGAMLALTAGKLAGDTACAAIHAGDFRAKTLAAYQGHLRGSAARKAAFAAHGIFRQLARHGRFFAKHPELLSELAEELFILGCAPGDATPQRVRKTAIRTLKRAADLLGVPKGGK
jgi:electron transfer flavoprotein-quinone oxidoreductase